MATEQLTSPRAPASTAALLAIAAVVVLGAIMSILDTTVVNVAINTLATRLRHAADDDPVGRHRLHARARDGDPAHRLGRRPLRHQAALHDLDRASSCSARSLSGLAWSAESLIVFRVLQGLGGGMIMPAGMTILTRAAGPQRVGRVMAIIGVPMLLGPILGPILGGWLVDDVSWRWIFFINLPIGIVALVARLPRSSPRDVPQPAHRLDWLGLALLSPGLALLDLRPGGVRLARRLRLRPRCSAADARRRRCCSSAFVAPRAAHADEPLIDLRLFKQPHVRGRVGAR